MSYPPPKIFATMFGFKRKITKKEQTVQARRKRRDVSESGSRNYLETSQIISTGLFLLMLLAVVFICFAGQSPAGPQLLPNQVAKFRVVAEIPFSYESRVRTRRLMDQRRQQVEPVYVLNPKVYDDFRSDIRRLAEKINLRLPPELPLPGRDELIPLVEEMNRNFRLESGLHLNTEDILTVITHATAGDRAGLLQEGLLALRDIMREGVFETPRAGDGSDVAERFYRPIQVIGRSGGERAYSEEEAARLLRINLAGLETNLDVSRAMFRIFRKGLSPNLEYDPGRTEDEKRVAADNVAAVLVNVRQGDVIIEPGSVITPEQLEMNAAYRAELRKRDEVFWGFNLNMEQRIFYTMLLLLGAIVCVRVAIPRENRSNRRLLLASTVLLISLLLLRVVQQFGETELFGAQAGLIALLPYAAPVALGPIILTIIIGSPPAVILGLVVAALNAMMQGNSIEIFLMSLTAILVAIYFCRDIRLRGKVVRAGLLSGVAFGSAAIFAGLLNEINVLTISYQALTAGLVGALSGALAIGILPMLENLFKYTTDITLLELTDYNHPLLRKLQLVAPGSYHHSLMVANLAERAANEIRANALLCRATCLYHDIGKMAKPEYFNENQSEGFNPHDTMNPTMSAIIIKNHVKEGQDMARQAKLPKIFMDIIQQHHGTTLIQFFYNRALGKAREKVEAALAAAETEAENDGDDDMDDVDESSFRYDGPKPQFKESAIIFFADAVEAASRSLNKVTPQAVNDLIEKIFSSRMADGQLDEAPLTLKEIRQIKDSFAFTLLNMLHSRVEYPKTANGNGRKKGSRAPMVVAPPPPMDEGPPASS